MRKTKTNFCYCGMFEYANVKPFEFYMLFNLEDIKGKSVGEYSVARKMCVLM